MSEVIRLHFEISGDIDDMIFSDEEWHESER